MHVTCCPNVTESRDSDVPIHTEGRFHAATTSAAIPKVSVMFPQIERCQRGATGLYQISCVKGADGSTMYVAGDRLYVSGKQHREFSPVLQELTKTRGRMEGMEWPESLLQRLRDFVQLC